MGKILKVKDEDIVEDESIYGYKGDGCLHILDNKENAEIIESKSFLKNKRLVSVCLPEGIKHIGPLSFAYCENLMEIVLPTTVKRSVPSAFRGTKLVYKSKLKNGKTLLSTYDASKVSVDKEWDEYSVVRTRKIKGKEF